MFKTGTKGKGLVFTPDESNWLEFYADVDFSGAWCREDADQVGSDLSRTGYIIKFANFQLYGYVKCKQR